MSNNFNPDPYQNPYQAAPDSYQNTMPNSYPYSHFNPFAKNQPPLHQPPTPPKPSWFKRQRKRTKAGIGCLALIGVLALCGLCTAAFPTTNKANQNTQASTQSTPRVAATATPTPKPTPKPTATPTPKPKPTSTPTPKVVAQTQPVQQQQPVATQAPAPVQKPAPPAPAPTTPPAPPTGVNGNPWGYNFTSGNYITNPNAGFCSYFTCVTTFWSSTSGYVEECVDGEYSHSGGRSGACSHNGGEMRPLLSN